MNEKDDKLNKGSFLCIGDQDKAEWGYPEGYPYKEGGSFDLCSTEGDERVEYSGGFYSTVFVRVSDLTPSFAEMQAATVTANGQTGPYTDLDSNLIDKGGYTALFAGEFGFVTYKPNTETVIGTLSTPGIWISNKHAEQYGASFPNGLVVTYGTTHPIAPDFLPQATSTTYGSIKKAAHVPHVTEAPTSNDFNKLLSALREVGIMSQAQ